MGPWASPLILIWVLAASVELIRTRGVLATSPESLPEEAQARDVHVPVTQ